MSNSNIVTRERQNSQVGLPLNGVRGTSDVQICEDLNPYGTISMDDAKETISAGVQTLTEQKDLNATVYALVARTTHETDYEELLVPVVYAQLDFDDRNHKRINL